MLAAPGTVLALPGAVLALPGAVLAAPGSVLAEAIPTPGNASRQQTGPDTPARRPKHSHRRGGGGRSQGDRLSGGGAPSGQRRRHFPANRRRGSTDQKRQAGWLRDHRPARWVSSSSLTLAKDHGSSGLGAVAASNSRGSLRRVRQDSIADRATIVAA
ncbi:hypothetical protein GCM10027445_36580 [Amycolatopsis endophytica]